MFGGDALFNNEFVIFGTELTGLMTGIAPKIHDERVDERVDARGIIPNDELVILWSDMLEYLVKDKKQQLMC